MDSRPRALGTAPVTSVIAGMKKYTLICTSAPPPPASHRPSATLVRTRAAPQAHPCFWTDWDGPGRAEPVRLAFGIKKIGFPHFDDVILTETMWKTMKDQAPVDTQAPPTAT